MRLNERVLKVCVPLASTALCLLCVEIGIRGYRAVKRSPSPPKVPPLHKLTDSPVLYGLNPDHPEISSQAFRDDEVAIPKAPGTLRVLVLGDSIAYGEAVDRDATFPNRLEDLLQQRFAGAEVVNSGVMGYTTYNELQYYLTSGRELDPDIVVLAFCMNDVANPRLHWFYSTGRSRIVEIPEEAIPNLDYDRTVAVPMLEERIAARQRARRERQARKRPLWERSALYSALERRVGHLFERRTENRSKTGSGIPTHITGEDTISIEVLLEDSSPEWRWLTSIYRQLDDAVRADRARFVIALFPLAYQMDADYPFFPQDRIMAYCERSSIHCIDLLPAFRQHRKEDLFLLDKSPEGARAWDIWHLTEYGHQVSAQIIRDDLEETGAIGR